MKDKMEVREFIDNPEIKCLSFATSFRNDQTNPVVKTAIRFAFVKDHVKNHQDKKYSIITNNYEESTEKASN